AVAASAVGAGASAAVVPRGVGDMRIGRIARHLVCSARRTRAIFTPAVLAQIEAAIGAAEALHDGEIRFAIETALPLPLVWHDLSARMRAIELFARLRIWDTQANNGVLIYVLRADRAVEIIADRGINQRVSSTEWELVCREVETHYRAGRYEEGSRAAVAGVARLLALHFPAGRASGNELPNQPILL
ncbi:MAG: TPM domain-containing protein, partial [Steroidobacterales bacterium]